MPLPAPPVCTCLALLQSRCKEAGGLLLVPEGQEMEGNGSWSDLVLKAGCQLIN